jgi:integrase
MARMREGSTRIIDGQLYARVRYVDESGKRKEKLKKAENITHAKTLIKLMLKEIDEHGAASLDYERLTFIDLADYYEQHHVRPAVWVDGRKVAGLRSLHTHKYVVDVFRAFFGTRRLRSITYGDLDRLRLKRVQMKTVHGKQRSITTVNREMEVLRNMFSLALREGWILRNPFNAGPPLILKSHEKKRERILTVEEEERLLAACTGRRAHLHPVIICALDTGMRRGEILSLTWSDVDFESRLIHIKAFNTKTECERTLAVTDRLFGELQALYAASEKRPDERVFGIADNVKKSFTSACRDAKIQGLRFHDTRHTFATRLVEQGVPAEMVSKLLGHTTIAMTSRYVNTTVRTARLAVDALEAMQSNRQEASKIELIN